MKLLSPIESQQISGGTIYYVKDTPFDIDTTGLNEKCLTTLKHGFNLISIDQNNPYYKPYLHMVAMSYLAADCDESFVNRLILTAWNTFSNVMQDAIKDLLKN